MGAPSLKTGFRLVHASVVTLVVGITLLVGFGLAYTHAHIDRANELDDVVRDLLQLRILGAEYRAAPSPRVEGQWWILYRRVRDHVGAQPGLPAEVREVLEGLAPRFQQLAAISADARAPGAARLRLGNQLAATLDLETQRVTDWASKVSREAERRMIPRLAAAGGTAVAVMLGVAFATIATLVLTSRRILGAVATLKEGAAEIAAGRLGTQVASDGGDEMASLAASINQMSRELSGTYARLQERTRQLEAEVAERVRVEREHARLEAHVRQAQKMEAVGLFAGGVAHDFNNVLSVIMSCGSTLRAGASGDEARECVDEILRASRQAAELTRGLLAFGRQQDFALERTDVNQLAAENARFLKRVIGEDIELVVEPSPAPLHALVDRSQMQQVLMNLAANARDAMPKRGRLTIHVALERPDDDVLAVAGYGKPEPHVLLRVSDTGSGMAPATVERIFEPFFTTKEQGRGTGLGLSIIHGIVTQHRGHVVCRSAPGAGTTFSIYLPCSPEGEAQTPEPPAGTGRSLRGSETILVAEDDAMVMSATTRICEAGGYRVIQARDGEEAVELFRRHAGEIDLVVLDAIMPKLTGKEAWERIRAIRPDARGCVVSGYAQDPLSGAPAADAALPFVGKPFTPEQLLRKIREILDAPG